jgi:hypothetical protein
MWPIIDDIVGAYDAIHAQYLSHSMGKHAITGHPFGPHVDYELSSDVGYLSKVVWGRYKEFPDLAGFDKVSEALRDMAIELQIGPPRELYHTMPRLSFA